MGVEVLTTWNGVSKETDDTLDLERCFWDLVGVSQHLFSPEFSGKIKRRTKSKVNVSISAGGGWGGLSYNMGLS